MPKNLKNEAQNPSKSFLGALLGALGALLGTLGGLLGASWAQLVTKNKKKYLLELNLEVKIHPSWLQNPLNIDVKKQLVFKHVLSTILLFFWWFVAPNFGDFLYVLSLMCENADYVKFSVFPNEIY